MARVSSICAAGNHFRDLATVMQDRRSQPTGQISESSSKEFGLEVVDLAKDPSVTAPFARSHHQKLQARQRIKLRQSPVQSFPKYTREQLVLLLSMHA